MLTGGYRDPYQRLLAVTHATVDVSSLGNGGVPYPVLTSVDGDIAAADNARRAGAAGSVNKVDLANAPLAELLGGE